MLQTLKPTPQGFVRVWGKGSFAIVSLRNQTQHNERQICEGADPEHLDLEYEAVQASGKVSA